MVNRAIVPLIGTNFFIKLKSLARFKLILIRRALFCILSCMAFLVGVRSIADTNCAHEQISIYYKTKQHAKFCVELAINNEERQRGLMFRKEMELSDGMMFVYDRPQSVSFWMKNTSIPLDIIFADEAGKITKIFENARPFSTTSIFGGYDVQYVLEINAGLTKSLGIKPGALIKHSLLPPGN